MVMQGTSKHGQIMNKIGVKRTSARLTVGGFLDVFGVLADEAVLGAIHVGDNVTTKHAQWETYTHLERLDESRKHTVHTQLESSY